MPSPLTAAPRWALLLCAALIHPAGASSFLSRVQGEGEEVDTISAELQSTILQQIEETLGMDKATIEDRLGRTEDLLRTTFTAMPKNDAGKLEHAAVRYALHGYFVQSHGWYVRGLSDTGEGFNSTSASGILQDRVEDFVQGVFEQRMGAHGLGLREIAVLAATFEDLVRHEAMQRLDDTLNILKEIDPRNMDTLQADTVIETYMMSYIMRFNFTTSWPGALQQIRDRVHKIYPGWSETQKFLQEMREESCPRKSSFSRADVEDALERIGDHYGHFQNKDCQKLKAQLLSLEDRSIGTNGSGRVRLVDFYSSALHDGNWQLSETSQYLAQNGALDTSDPRTPRVIIANYINSPTNCVAGSRYYSACCMNECEDLLDALERRFRSPMVATADILEAIAAMPSSSVTARSTLPSVLVSRLKEVAAHHGGLVPLHSRLFAQWMHHAYPRECPYPHVAGSIRPQRSRDYRQEKGLSATVKKDDLAGVLERLVAETSQEPTEQEESHECTPWSHHEELYVSTVSDRHAARLVRPFAYVLILAAAAFMLRGWVMSSGKTMPGSKSGGKDCFV